MVYHYPEIILLSFFIVLEDLHEKKCQRRENKGKFAELKQFIITYLCFCPKWFRKHFTAFDSVYALYRSEIYSQNFNWLSVVIYSGFTDFETSTMLLHISKILLLLLLLFYYYYYYYYLYYQYFIIIFSTIPLQYYDLKPIRVYHHVVFSNPFYYRFRLLF